MAHGKAWEFPDTLLYATSLGYRNGSSVAMNGTVGLHVRRDRPIYGNQHLPRRLQRTSAIWWKWI